MRVVDLFSGCGGSSLGWQSAGCNVKAAYEWWDKAAAVYSANFNHPVIQMDLSDVSAAISSIREYAPDVIIGSPPCQDFSIAGKRVEGDRAALTVTYAQIVAAVKPICFVMENVKEAQKSKAYAEAREIFKRAGYGLTETVLTASYYGVPQRRKRFFCIGCIGDADGILSAALAQAASKTEMTMRDYFSNALGVDHYYAHPRTGMGKRQAVFSIDTPSPTIASTYSPRVPPGYKRHHSDAVDASKTYVRALTIAERAAVQTFPDDFIWPELTGNQGALNQMIGNAVPPKLAEAVARVVKNLITP